MSTECLISIIELAAGVDHLLLAEGSELISSKDVLIIFDELISFPVGSDGGVDLLDGRVICGRLGSGWITSSVARQNLNEVDLTMGWHTCGDLRFHREVWRVLTPVLRDGRGAGIASPEIVT